MEVSGCPDAFFLILLAVLFFLRVGFPREREREREREFSLNPPVVLVVEAFLYFASLFCLRLSSSSSSSCPPNPRFKFSLKLCGFCVVVFLGGFGFVSG